MPESESRDVARPSATAPFLPSFLRRSSTTRLLEYLLLAALVGLFIWRAFIPAWSALSSDFPNYYLVARLYRQGYPLDRVYEWTWLQRQKDHAGLENVVAAYVPVTLPSILPTLPLTSLSVLQAKHGWMILDLIFLGLAGLFAGRLTGLGWRRIALFTFLCIFPLRNNFIFGQQHVLVLLLLTLAAWLYFSGRPASSGAVLAAAAALKIYPAMFALYFLRKRQWRAFISLALGLLIMAGLSLWLFGYEANRVYVMEIFPRAMRGEVADPYHAHWQSATALFRRLFIAEPEFNPQPLVHWPAAFAFLQPLCQALIFVPFLWLISSNCADAEREKLDWGSYLLMLLVLSPNPASYHYCVLILSAVLIAGYLARRGLTRLAVAFAFLYGLACISHYRWMAHTPSGWRILLGFPRLYAVIALTLFVLWILATASHRPFRARLKSREAMAFAGLFLAMVTAGTWSMWRHLKGQFENYSMRAVVIPTSLMAGQPAAAGGDIYFTHITADGYALCRSSGGALTSFKFHRDAFHPAVPAKASEGWVEIASTRSRILRFPVSGPLPPADRLPVEVMDGEQPAISPDGRWLAFIREDKGRGFLWVKDMRPEETTDPANIERQLTRYELNVLEATFTPDSRGLVFSAQREAQPELLSVSIEGNSPVITQRPDVGRLSARYPAFSPDGVWLAFSSAQRGAWQLCVVKAGSGTIRQLTHGECNSITPAWLPDSRTIVYATDCGRGQGLTALARIQAVP
ncbi:MAG: glycosyltransferase 87 family protein [Terriglobia bacterium]